MSNEKSVPAPQLPRDPDFHLLFANYMEKANASAHKREYAIGDECWFHADDYDDVTGTPKLTHGVVVCWLELESMPDIQYIIRPTDNKYTHLEVRDWRIMTADKNTFPAIWPPEVKRKPPHKPIQ